MQNASLSMSFALSLVALGLLALPACTVNTTDNTGAPGSSGAVTTGPDQSCSQGRCHQECASGTSCTVGCSGGGCEQICDANATCTLACSGGGCRQTCIAGSKCTLSCSGDGCAVDR